MPLLLQQRGAAAEGAAAAAAAARHGLLPLLHVYSVLLATVPLLQKRCGKQALR